MRYFCSVIAALVLTPAATTARDAPPPGTDRFVELVAAERRFAADAGRIGITAAFRRHTAPSGVLLRPEPVRARDALATDKDVAGLTLEWGPEFAVMASSGDLGATTGPYRMRLGAKTMRGRYFTVWQRGTDGRWAWLIDHGLPPSPGDVDPHPGKVTRLPSGTQRPVLDAAISEIDDQLNTALVTQGGRAIAAMLAVDARVLRSDARDMTAAEARPVLDAEVPTASARRFGLHLSNAGDLAVSYGAVQAVDARQGHYVRVWRRTERGWALLIDEIAWVPRA